MNCWLYTFYGVKKDKKNTFYTTYYIVKAIKNTLFLNINLLKRVDSFKQGFKKSSLQTKTSKISHGLLTTYFLKLYYVSINTTFLSEIF